jgi:EAL domain-containing protein (putative c-di-GMP-specific phosphodiesterase class I)
VLREACRQAGEWFRTRRNAIVVSVNASPLQLADPGFCDDLEHALEAANLPPNHLVIEITERLIVEDDFVTVANIRRLNSIGIRVALDDFGTGYSALSYLTRFQIHSIKIDKSFIRHIATDVKARALVQAIIGIGKSLNVSMVAEGVETQEQADILKNLGCAFLQGYLISRPVAPAAI